MSRILVDELVNLAGTDKVTFAEGLKVTAGEALDLNGAKINIDTGVGLNNQLLASTGSGLKWTTISDTNSTYAFSSVNAAANDVKLKLTGGGDAAGQIDQLTFTGAGTVVVAENAGVITITGSDQNTTYDLVASTVTDGAQLTLTGIDSSNDIVSILGGSNITVARSGTDITISGSVGLQARAEVDGVTASLANDATENINITAHKAYVLLYIETDNDAWVRVYTDDTSRTADASRSEGSDPSAGSGVIAETRGTNVIWLSPGVIGYNADTPSATDTMYLAVTNRSGSTNSIHFHLNLIRLEA